MMFDKDEKTISFYSHLRLRRYKRNVDMGKPIILIYAYNIFGVCHASYISQGMQCLNGWGDLESQPCRELCSKTGF